jgi:hypothetical protein
MQELFRSGGVNFDEWWDEWRNGFRNRVDVKKANTTIDDWVKPKYIELPSVSKENKSGVRVIKYYPDAGDETIFYYLSGNDRDLIFHITAIHYQSGGNEDNVSGKNSKPGLKGLPALELLFISENRQKKALKIIRCPGYTDNPTIANMNLAKLVKPADVIQWAKKIKVIFGDTKYCWSKGIECLSYSGLAARLQGIEGYAYVRNENDGIALFTNLLKIHDFIPDKSGFNYSGKTDKSKLNKPGQTVKVLNKSVKIDIERSIVDCYFYQATLRLPLLKKTIPLVRKNVIVYKS